MEIGDIPGIAGLCLSLFLLFRDRAWIRVSTRNGYRHVDPRIKISDSDYSQVDTYFVVEVINVGRRSVKIESVVAKLLATEESVIFIDSLTKTNDKKVLTEDHPKARYFLNEKELDINDVWCVEVSDAAGRKYRKYQSVTLMFRWIFRRKKKDNNSKGKEEKKD